MTTPEQHGWVERLRRTVQATALQTEMATTALRIGDARLLLQHIDGDAAEIKRLAAALSNANTRANVAENDRDRLLASIADGAAKANGVTHEAAGAAFAEMLRAAVDARLEAERQARQARGYGDGEIERLRKELQDAKSANDSVKAVAYSVNGGPWQCAHCADLLERAEKAEANCKVLHIDAVEAERERDEAVERAEKAETEVLRLDDMVRRATGLKQSDILAEGIERLERAEAVARAEKAERERDEVGVQLTACRERLTKADAVIAPARRFARAMGLEVFDPTVFPSAMEMHSALRDYDTVDGDVKAKP